VLVQILRRISLPKEFCDVPEKLDLYIKRSYRPEGLMRERKRRKMRKMKMKKT
jgi:hypothetical protein